MNHDAEPAALLDAVAPRLRHFVAVAREQHVTRAAELLGVPQPTLSRSIARLEADLGVPLLARVGRTVRLTRHGREFLVSAERALAELERGVRRLAGEASPEHGRVAFAFLHTLGTQAVPAILRAFRARHPRVRFTLVQDGADAMLARLRSGEVDLCLTSPLPDEPGVAVQALDEQRLDLFVPSDHPLAARRHVRLAEAAAEDFVCMEPGYGLRRISDDLCRAAGFTPHVAFEGEEVDTLRGLVAAGLGVALLPASPGDRFPGVTAVPVSEPRASRTLGLAWLADRPAPPPVAAFRDFLLGYRGRLLVAR